MLRPFLFGLLTVLVGRGLAQTTITLQPGPADGEDAFLANCIPCGYADTNFGTSPDVSVAAWTNNGAESDGRSLIRFDLSMIPADATVGSASLSLYFNPSSVNGDDQSLSGPNTAVLQRVTSAWNESTVTWNTQPATDDADQVIIPQTTTSAEDRPDLDVTTLVQGMVSAPATNYGLMLRLQDETHFRRMIFASSDHADPALHPKLVVTFTSPSTTCLTFQPGPVLGNDAFLAGCIPCGYDQVNFGTSPDLSVAAWTNEGAESNGRSLIRFDLSTIPANATVSSAALSLYFNPTSVNGDDQSLSGPNTAVLQRVTSSWNESTVTWETQPSTEATDQVIIPQTTTTAEDRPDLDVTALVQGMVSDPATNYGLMLRLLDETYYRRMIFASSDHTDPARWPKLVVCYDVGTGIGSSATERVAVPVYPVPFTTSTQVDLAAFGQVPVTLTVSDLNGRIVREEQATGGGIVTLARGTMASGCYVLSLQARKQPVSRARLVVQ